MRCRECRKELTHKEARYNDGLCDTHQEVKEAIEVERERIKKEGRIPSPPNSHPPQVNPLDSKVMTLKNKVQEVKQQRNKLLSELKSLVSLCKSIGTFENGVKYWGQDEGEVLAEKRIKSAGETIDKIEGDD